jgi:hypothetical protein
MLYDSPCAIRLKGDLEALIRDFPFGTLTAEIIKAISCKEHPPAPCDPLYVKADELMVSETALALWNEFRQGLGKVKLIYLPSQLSEMVRYDSDFDSFGDDYLNYGDEEVMLNVDAPLSESEACFEAVLFSLTDGAEEEGAFRVRQSLITQKRRYNRPQEQIAAVSGYTNGIGLTPAGAF